MACLQCVRCGRGGTGGGGYCWCLRKFPHMEDAQLLPQYAAQEWDSDPASAWQVPPAARRPPPPRRRRARHAARAHDGGELRTRGTAHRAPLGPGQIRADFRTGPDSYLGRARLRSVPAAWRRGPCRPPSASAAIGIRRGARRRPARTRARCARGIGGGGAGGQGSRRARAVRNPRAALGPQLHQ